MARRSHHALSAAVAAACLTLGACGAAAAPFAAGSPTASGHATGSAGSAGSAMLTGHFCRDAASFLRHIPAVSTTKHTSAAQGRASLRKVLRSTVAGFRAVRAEAPARLHKPLKTIVGVYQSDEKVLSASGDLGKFSQSMVKGNAAGSMAFQRVVKYISVNCK